MVLGNGCLRLAPLTEMAVDPSVDIVLIATSGVAGLPAALAALEAGKIVALANKEILVIAGALLRRAAATRAADVVRWTASTALFGPVPLGGTRGPCAASF